ncbi:uncharacterized protein M421DRAFT_295261 [Didymella exigua CBS 183.55]|uniref:Uncharacterized protein n=1 Tax=Didymella exigua CBS 183.55 TaxID=1150837 RepID=A0A6A5RAH2_9PLEO|nr:uncharacterized protein M421DRAFT_295261 [Didymella exigua CBS 183.55]KAF1924309.1 hypothetical protein M421DRAFT_295261 [Didymella exigua CBS 183.55]
MGLPRHRTLFFSHPLIYYYLREQSFSPETILLGTLENMSSATAPRKDSAQSSKEGLQKRTHDHAPLETSPLANCSDADIVTNDERAKSPDIMRVLSPMRPRRTPKLVNAPEMKWRLPPHLQHMPSLDSLLSSATSASEPSTVRKVPVAPRDIALPVSSASSIITTLSGTVVQDPPVPTSPSPPQTEARLTILTRINDRYNEARVNERPRITPHMGAHQPHYLSPVTEATSSPSIRSSIIDLMIEEVGTAERHPLSDVRRQNVHVIGASEIQDVFDRRGLRGNGEREEQYSISIREAECGGEFVVGAEEADGRVSLRRVYGRLKKSVKGTARRFVEDVARNCVTRALARVL